MFSSSVQFSEPAVIGDDAFAFIFPAKSEIGKDKMIVSFVRFSAYAQSEMQMSDEELISFAKSTYFEILKPSVSVKKRIIFGKKSVGEIFLTKAPSTSKLEIHLIQLPDDSKIVIGFKFSIGLSEEQTETIISEILGSLKEK
jgi:hypothetical protein